MNLLALAIIGVLVLIFLSAVLSPLESLVWWAGWERDEDPLSPGPHGLHGNDGALRDDEGPAPAQSTHYIVYLSGIGALSGTSIPAEEVPFIQELQARLPHTRIVDDVFPYSVANRGLTGEHALAWFWQKLEQSRINNAGSLAALLINLRNAWQVLVSADPRYGPYMNLGVAQEIGSALLRCGYEPGSGTPVTLIGWSGGGQIAVGAARYLWKLNAPLRIISLGGILSDDPGLDKIECLWHVYGQKDYLHRLGGLLYLGRWPIMQKSYWNRGLAAGKITRVELGPYQHNGTCNYFDMHTPLPDTSDCTYGEKTITTIIELLDRAGVPT